MTSERVYSALLYIYPKGFRMEYGDAMCETFMAIRRDTRQALIPFWTFVVTDVFCSAWTEHLRVMTPSLRYFARCGSAAVLGTAVLGGTIAAIAAASGPPDLRQELQVVDSETGWLSTRVGHGPTRVVPSITLTLRSLRGVTTERVRVMAVFQRAGEQGTWSTASVSGMRSTDWQPYASTAEIAFRSPIGYTGAESSIQLLRDEQFVDVHVRILAKRDSWSWQAIGEWPVQRQLLEPQEATERQ